MGRVFVKKQGWVNMLSLAQKARLPKAKLKKYRKKLSTIKKSYTGKFIDKDAYNKYKAYIKSKEWAEKRELTLDYYGNQCCYCGNKYDLQCHHRHYRSLYKEKMTDLLILCRKCHANQHAKK